MWRQPLYGVPAAAAAVLAMAAVAAAGIQLVGANQYGQTGPLTAAAVVLGAGGTVDLSLSVDGAPLRVGGDGALAGLDGPLGELLNSRLAELGGDPTLSLARLASDGPGWLLPVGVAGLTLLACGALAATRTRVPADGVRAAAMRAGLLGVVLATALPALAALAGITLHARLAFFGNAFGLIEAELHTSPLLAAALGLGGGAAAGFIGSMAVDIRGVWAGRRSYARH